MAKRIYVADDEKNICFLIQNFLEKEGFEVRCFEDGESILAACEEQMPDLCILDVMMPGMDGLTVCTRIRQKSHVPIIIVSAKDSPLDRITGITLGSDDYLVKPFLPLELVTRVKALFRRVDAFSGQEEENSENLELGDIVPFPGEDKREFWQRAEERNQNTARLYDKLGMAEYQAIEVFVRLF